MDVRSLRSRPTHPGLMLAAATTVSAGAVAGWWVPRGPVTTVEAVVTVVASLVLGFAAGRLTGSRWALLGAPLSVAVIFELVRMRTDGPTVDGIRIDGISRGTGATDVLMAATDSPKAWMSRRRSCWHRMPAQRVAVRVQATQGGCEP